MSTDRCAIATPISHHMHLAITFRVIDMPPKKRKVQLDAARESASRRKRKKREREALLEGANEPLG